jgi:hypothetical protein
MKIQEPGHCEALRSCFVLAFIVPALLSSAAAGDKQPAKMEPVRVGKDNKSFVLEPSGKRFIPWGFNYDHDEKGDLIEDYWDKEWARVEQDFREMKDLDANVVRIHLQLAKFMKSQTEADEKSLHRLGELLKLAEKERLYLDLTGLGCYHKRDVPPWYDPLSEQERWDVQARFWQAVAKTCAGSPAVFCYDLMNEPVVPGKGNKRTDWLGAAFGGKHFVQFISLDTKDRERPDVARAWIKHLVAAIRKEDKSHLITVGLVDWSLDKPGLSSGFVPEKIAADLDFISVHLYPKAGKLDEALATLKGFAVGKPVVIEETFVLHCSLEEMDKFIDQSRQVATGWIGFYWGKTVAESRKSDQFVDALMVRWLEFFQEKGKKIGKG